MSGGEGSGLKQAIPSSLLDRDAHIPYPGGMETRQVFRPRVWRAPLAKTRLWVATMRLTDAEQERIWAIMVAHEAGLSIRQTAAICLGRRPERRV
jgi:hypothetical protein